ncbi:FxLYD domain-containing protein [Chloroflexota bacterium]
MLNRRNGGFLIILFSFVFVSLACSLGSSSEPTQTPPQAGATAATVEPTVAPVEPIEEVSESTDALEPTDAIVQEPAEEPSDSSTEAPPAEEKEPETPPPDNEVYIKSIKGYRDDLGYLHIVGLVTNNTDRTVDNVEVEVEILDNNGNSLQVELTTISLYTLGPGETSPFAYWVSEELPNADNYRAIVVGQSAAEIERATIKADGVLLTVDDNGDIHITGKLVNNTINPILVDSLAAATFDENGELVAADSHSVIVRHLDPGEDGPFRVTMTGPEGDSTNIEEYEIYIDAAVSNPVEVFDFVTSESHYYYIDSYDAFHLVGEVTNNNDEFFTITLIAGIYDEEGNVVDAATTDIPTFSIAPGATLPYDFQYWGPLNFQAGTIDAATNYYVQWDPYWTWSSSSEYVDLSTTNDSNEVGAYQVTFTGDVVNDSNEEVDGATVIVSLYNIESGDLVAMGYGGIYDPIAPNATAAYQVWIDPPVDFDINAVEYEIVAKGDLP